MCTFVDALVLSLRTMNSTVYFWRECIQMKAEIQSKEEDRMQHHTLVRFNASRIVAVHSEHYSRISSQNDMV